MYLHKGKCSGLTEGCYDCTRIAYFVNTNTYFDLNLRVKGTSNAPRREGCKEIMTHSPLRSDSFWKPCKIPTLLEYASGGIRYKRIIDAWLYHRFPVLSLFGSPEKLGTGAVCLLLFIGGTLTE